MFSPLFIDNSDVNSVNDAYLMIDQSKFTVLPAVPTLHQNNNHNNLRSQKSFESPRQNILFPARPALQPISTEPIEQPLSVPNQEISNNEIFNDDPPETFNAVTTTATEQRKKYKKCHGRCVQKFCLPIGSLQKHASCQSKCKDICSL